MRTPTNSALPRLIVIATLVAMNLPPSTTPVHAGDDPSDIALEELLKKARKDESARSSVLIEVEGQLDAGLHQIDIYGRGIGIWNGDSQFTLKSKEVVSAIDLLLQAKFCDMPDRFAFEEVDDERPMPINERPMPIKMMRAIKVTAGGLSKTVIQDNKGPRSEPFAKLTADLVALCRKPAETALTATNLEDGLRKVADGVLAPETLTVTVNAPELRSLKSQKDQGWQLVVRHSKLILHSVTLDHGVNKVGEQTLDAAEVQKLARKLLDAGAPNLPSNLNTAGYTQLMVAVLNQKVRTMARVYATPPDDGAKAAMESFSNIRQDLYLLYKQGAEERPSGN